MRKYLPLIGLVLTALLLPGGVVHADNPMTFVIGLIMTVFLSIAGFFLWLSGELLSFVVTLTVLQAGNTMNLKVIEDVWTLFRSFADILLLFVLLFIGIGTILRWKQYEIKQLLPPLVIVALLLNFSIFFTKVIVDFTNIVAIEFYQAATGDGKFRVSEVIADQLGVITIYNESSFGNDTYSNAAQGGSGLSAGDILVGGIMGIILFLISAMILFSSAITLVVRFVILLFLMMLSPLAFVAYLTPATKKYATLWWQTFLQNAIFAPVFFMLLWASLWVMQGIDIFSVQDGINLSTLNDSAAAGGGAVGQVPTAAAILLNFMIVIAMLVASLLIANKISKMGGNAVVKGANGMIANAGIRAGKFTARAGFDATARLGRATAGAGMEMVGNRLATSRTLTGVATSENKNFMQRWAAKTAIDAGRGLKNTGQTASFNMQGVVEKGITAVSGSKTPFTLDSSAEATKLRQRGRKARADDQSEKEAAWAKELGGLRAAGVTAWSVGELARLNSEVEKYEKQVETAEIAVDEAEAVLQDEKSKENNKAGIEGAERKLAEAKRDRQRAKNEKAKVEKAKGDVDSLVTKSATNVFDEPATLANKALETMYAPGGALDKANKELARISVESGAARVITKRYEDQKKAYGAIATDLRRQHDAARARNDTGMQQTIDRQIAENGRKLQALNDSMVQVGGEYATAAATQAELEAVRASTLSEIASYNDQVKTHLDAIKSGMKDAGRQHLETQKSLAVDRLKSGRSLYSYTSWARDPTHYRSALDEQIKKNYPKKPEKK